MPSNKKIGCHFIMGFHSYELFGWLLRLKLPKALGLFSHLISRDHHNSPPNPCQLSGQMSHHNVELKQEYIIYYNMINYCYIKNRCQELLATNHYCGLVILYSGVQMIQIVWHEHCIFN